MNRHWQRVDADRAGEEGFTLIELLMVVVIIAVLAMIAIPQFSSTREQAYQATLREALSRLQVVQDSFRASHGRYAGMEDTVRLHWVSPETIHLDTLVGEQEGWWAVLNHRESELKCGLAHGRVGETPDFLSSKGEVLCRTQ